MKFIPSVIIVALVILTSISCKEEELLKGNWEITEFYRETFVSSGGQPHSDVNYLDSVMVTCRKDNVYEILDDGFFCVKDVGENCSPEETIEGSWSYTDASQEFLEFNLDQDYILANDWLWGEIKLNPVEVPIIDERWKVITKTSETIFLSNLVQYTDINGNPIGEEEGIYLKFSLID